MNNWLSKIIISGSFETITDGSFDWNTHHVTALLDIEILRRDQVWFVEKNSDQASTLYPLSDFSPRKNEALERGYLVGSYGAVPFFSDFKI